jgi:hypothetical protein
MKKQGGAATRLPGSAASMVNASKEHFEMDFQNLFFLGMKRQMPPLIVRPGRVLDLGASGKYVVPGAEPLGAPNWMCPRDPIPAADDSIGTIHAHHFLEHLSGRGVPLLLREVERVLESGGVFNYTVPYYSSTLAIQNLEHQSQWCEDTLRNLFEDDTYEHEQGRNWRLAIHFQIIVGIQQRNLALVGQLVKDGPKMSYREWYYPQSI